MFCFVLHGGFIKSFKYLLIYYFNLVLLNNWIIIMSDENETDVQEPDNEMLLPDMTQIRRYPKDRYDWWNQSVNH